MTTKNLSASRCFFLGIWICAAAVLSVVPQVRAQPFTFTTLAGSPGVKGAADGQGTEARLHAPTGIAVHRGVVYTTEYRNGVIRKITADGTVVTLAGLAGSDGSVDGKSSEARFFHAHGIAVDAKGILYVTDYGNSTVRKVSPDGVVTTVAGLAGATGSVDGTGAAARFDHPEGVAVDARGNLFIADTFNYTIRKITPAGVVTTFAGMAGAAGSADGRGAAARFDVPIGITIDSKGVLYVVDGGFDTEKGNSTIRKILPDGTVTTLAGRAGSIGHADGKGDAARFHYPVGITVDKKGTLFVADSRNFTVRQVTPLGVVTTVAGTPGLKGVADGVGPDARFTLAQSIAVDTDGTLYVADTGNNTIRRGARVKAARRK